MNTESGTIARPFSVTPNTAIVLHAMVAAPAGWHCAQVIAETTGSNDITVRQCLARLFSNGWVIKRPGERTGQARPRMYYKFTPSGLRSARDELKLWNFEQTRA